MLILFKSVNKHDCDFFLKNDIDVKADYPDSDMMSSQN